MYKAGKNEAHILWKWRGHTLTHTPWGLDQKKMFLHSKGNHQKMKRQSAKLEKIFANHITDERLR